MWVEAIDFMKGLSGKKNQKSTKITCENISLVTIQDATIPQPQGFTTASPRVTSENVMNIMIKVRV